MSNEDEAQSRTAVVLAQLRHELSGIHEEVEGVLSREGNASSLRDVETELGEVLRNLQELRGSLDEATEGSSTLLAQWTSKAQAQDIAQARQAFWDQLVEITKDAVSTVEEGYRGVHNTIDTLEHARRAMGAAGERRSTLSTLVEGVGDFLALIAHINKRTNLLALNASIAAAQAGEHGRAFMIIAREVKTLADKTSQSTREIEDSMHAILQENDAVANAIDETSGALDSGYKAASDAGDTLVELRKRIARVARRAQSDARSARDVDESIDGEHYLKQVHAASVDALNDWTMASDRLAAVHRMIDTTTTSVPQRERQLESLVRRLVERLERIELQARELERLNKRNP